MQNQKLKVVMYLNRPGDAKNACIIYRNINPMKYSKKDIDIRYISSVKSEIDFDPINKKVKNISIDAQPIEWADIVVFSRHYDQVSLMGCLMEVAQKMGKPVVYETDDLLHKVKLNTGGHTLDDSIDRNLRFIDYALEHCDLTTVTVEPLKKFYEENFKVKGIVLPNYYDPAMWRGLYLYKKLRDFWRKTIRRDKTIRIGWQGGNNHYLNNFNHIVEPLNRLKKKYKDKIQVVLLSGLDPRVDYYAGKDGKRKFLEFDFERRVGVDVDKFPRALAKMDLDIGLIVVDDNEFSRGKSNIKWLEYGILGIPAISSLCAPYLDTNAVLVKNTEEEWFNSLDEMVQNHEKRGKIGLEARRMSLEFNIKKHAWKWVEAYRQVLADKLKNRSAACRDNKLN